MMSPAVVEKELKLSTVSPFQEMLAFELLYSEKGSSLKSIAEMTVLSNRLPSQAAKERFGLIPPEHADEIRSYLLEKLGSLSVAVKNTPSWPKKLADSERPTPLFYYCGDIGLVETRSVSIVGSRKASEAGLKRASRLARELAEHGVTTVSGLARGIDTAAMTSAIKAGGNVIGVIGTPLDECYPRENRNLQNEVASHHLLVSQVPFYRYATQPFKTKRYYFPERNELMAAISDATIIVEASDASGTLTQARACLHQHRTLFILRSCYENQAVKWPRDWAQRPGVYVVDSVSSILDVLYGADSRA